VLNVQNGLLRFGVTNAAGAGALAAAPVPLNRWVHVAGELDDSTGQLSVWVDGVMANSLTTTVRPFATLDPGSTPGIGIGNVQSPNYNQYFDGFIDEVRISDQALAPTDFLPEPSVMFVGLCGLLAVRLGARRRPFIKQKSHW
jgi:hypothetical protein